MRHCVVMGKDLYCCYRRVGVCQAYARQKVPDDVRPNTREVRRCDGVFGIPGVTMRRLILDRVHSLCTW